MRQTINTWAVSALTFIACIAAATSSHAQGNSIAATSIDRWVGVWQGQLEGVPGVTVTLGNDLGEVNGTIVFTVLGAGSTTGNVEIVGHVVHLLLHPHVYGNTLSFQVNRPSGNVNEVLDMTLELSNDTTGELKCAKCGRASPTPMEKLQ